MIQNSGSLKSEINIFNALCNIYTKKRRILASICKFWVKIRANFQFIYGENVAKSMKNVCRFYTLESFLTFSDFGQQLTFFKSLNYLILRGA